MPRAKDKVYVKDLERGKIFEYHGYDTTISPGIIQYIGAYEHTDVDENKVKKHRFLWIKKPVYKIKSFGNYVKGKPTLEMFGGNIRGALRFIDE